MSRYSWLDDHTLTKFCSLMLPGSRPSISIVLLGAAVVSVTTAVPADDPLKMKLVDSVKVMRIRSPASVGSSLRRKLIVSRFIVPM